MQFLKVSFYLLNFILIFFYLYPASLIGCLFYDNCQFEPQLIGDLSFISTNHLYSFIFVSLFGFFIFKKKEIHLNIQHDIMTDTLIKRLRSNF